MLEIGKTYEVAWPSPTASIPRKKVLLLRLIGECWAEVREPTTSLVSLETRRDLIGPVEPVVITPENCAQCQGAAEIRQMADVPDEPWHRLWNGKMEPCPNCSTA